MCRFRMKISSRNIEIFRSKTLVSAGCWIWTGRKNDQGYGKLSIANRTEKAHRVSYVIHKGEIPSGLCVCHSCDNPSCVNPEHLWLGTQRENIYDCISKNRDNSSGLTAHGCKGMTCGEMHGHHKLTGKQVIEILAASKNGESNVSISRRYPVGRQAIYKITKHLRWGCIDNEFPLPVTQPTVGCSEP